MDFDEIISEFNNRSINEKTNNLIIVGNYSKQILDCIPSKCSIIKSDNIEIQALNIKIDLEKVNIKKILSYILNRINNYLDIEFNSKFDLISFDRE